MGNEVEQLMEMGFSRNRAEKALAKTNHCGVEAAMDWLFAHSEDPDIDDPFVPDAGHVLGQEEDQPVGESGGTADTAGEMDTSAGANPAQAMSLKCDDCGKLLRSEMDVQAHAARSGHANFSESTEEIKPLTEEEKKEQLQKVQERLKQRRVEKQEEEKQEQIKREKMRRATGKEMVNAKAKQEELEMKKLVEQRKREKMEEKLARQKVKDEIERDKRDRAAKFAKSQAASAPSGAAAAEAPAVTSPPDQQPKKTYDQCRLQIRLTNGQALTSTFSAKEQLAAVRLYVDLNRTDAPGPFTLMTSFPKKVFSDNDMEKPLSDLGLVPSAVLIVTKAQ